MRSEGWKRTKRETRVFLNPDFQKNDLWQDPFWPQNKLIHGI